MNLKGLYVIVPFLYTLLCVCHSGENEEFGSQKWEEVTFSGLIFPGLLILQVKSIFHH